jgi:hypothetical protein
MRSPAGFNVEELEISDERNSSLLNHHNHHHHHQLTFREHTARAQRDL